VVILDPSSAHLLVDGTSREGDRWEPRAVVARYTD
jgi:hypothetical protein